MRANHVFLLEPALDPAIEQQAVARVHRIGQQRPVRVVRFLVQSTIEEAVLAIQESRHKLFAKEEGAGGEEKAEEEEEDVDITTTVKSPVQQELIQAEDMSRLLDAVLKGG